MASHAAEHPTRRVRRPIVQPQRSTIQANTVGDAALITRMGVAMWPRTAPYPFAPNSASGTAPRTIVMTPWEAPMRNVNATTSGRCPVPANSRSSDGGRIPMAIRPTVMARRLRAKAISTTRPPNCATPLSDATQTAAAVTRPAASSKGTSWTETTPNTNRDERSTELALRDAIAFGSSGATLWLGARHTQLTRSATPTDGSPGTSFSQSFTTPFVAFSQELARGQLVYASWGKGVESDVAPVVPLDASATPPVPRYTNAGQALPAAESRQVELGIKGGALRAEWSAAAFDIRRPLFGDIGTCGPAQCTRGLVGEQRHRGVEGSIGWRADAWGVRAGAQWLRARVENPTDPTLDGKKPTNVPEVSARVQGDVAISGVAGLRLLAAGSYESSREVLPDNSAQIPSVTKFDIGARYDAKLADSGATWTLRAGIDNVFDRRAWRESPYQFGHAYLFPLEPRTFRVSLEVAL